MNENDHYVSYDQSKKQREYMFIQSGKIIDPRIYVNEIKKRIPNIYRKKYKYIGRKRYTKEEYRRLPKFRQDPVWHVGHYCSKIHVRNSRVRRNMVLYCANKPFVRKKLINRLKEPLFRDCFEHENKSWKKYKKYQWEKAKA